MAKGFAGSTQQSVAWQNAHGPHPALGRPGGQRANARDHAICAYAKQRTGTLFGGFADTMMVAEVLMKPVRIGLNAHAMTAERFRSAIRDIGISVDEFSFMTGTDLIDVQLWLLGHRELPKWVPSFLAAITVPEARLRASVIADRFCTEDETAGNHPIH